MGRDDRFGETAAPSWAEPTNQFERIAIDAARLQHDIVRVMNLVRREKGWTWRSVAPRLQTLSEVQLTKVVRGQAHLSLAHASDLSNEFGRLLLGGVTLRRVLHDNSELRKAAGA